MCCHQIFNKLIWRDSDHKICKKKIIKNYFKKETIEILKWCRESYILCKQM